MGAFLQKFRLQVTHCPAKPKPLCRFLGKRPASPGAARFFKSRRKKEGMSFRRCMKARKPCKIRAFWTALYLIELTVCGEGGIRTHGTIARTTVFETARFNHSRTSPGDGEQAQRFCVAAVSAGVAAGSEYKKYPHSFQQFFCPCNSLRWFRRSMLRRRRGMMAATCVRWLESARRM